MLSKSICLLITLVCSVSSNAAESGNTKKSLTTSSTLVEFNGARIQSVSEFFAGAPKRPNSVLQLNSQARSCSPLQQLGLLLTGVFSLPVVKAAEECRGHYYHCATPEEYSACTFPCGPCRAISSGSSDENYTDGFIQDTTGCCKDEICQNP